MAPRWKKRIGLVFMGGPEAAWELPER